MRARSRIVIDPDKILVINIGSEWGTVRFSIFTRHVDEGYEVAVPRELVIEAVGDAPSLDEAIAAFHGRSTALGAVIAFCGNAAVGLPEPHLAFDATAGRPERDFFEVFLPDDRGLVLSGRRLKVPETGAFLDRLSELPGEQLASMLGVLSRYGVALENWFLGGETLAITFLWLVAESFAKAVVGVEFARGRTLEEIADAYGMEREGGVAKRKLEGYVRWKIGFGGDQELHNDFKDLTDGLDHASIALREAHLRAAELAPKCFAALRSGMLSYIDPEGVSTEDLNRGVVALPLDTIQRRVVRGRLVNVGIDLAPDGEAYPILEWRSSIKSVTRDEQGNYNMQHTDKLTVRTADGVGFDANSIEIRGRTDGSTGEPPTVAEVQSSDAPKETQRDRSTPLLESVATALRELGPSKTRMEFTPVNGLLLEFHNITRGLFRACRALLADGLPEEAMILGRSLHRQAQWSTQLLAATVEDRAALIFGWNEASIETKRDLGQACLADLMLKKLKVAAGNEGITRFLHFDASEGNATTASDDDLIFLHAVAGVLDDGLSAGSGARLSSNEDTLTLTDTAPDSSIYPLAVWYTVENALLAMEAMQEVFGWTDDDGFLDTARSLLREFKRRVEHEQSGGTDSRDEIDEE